MLIRNYGLYWREEDISWGRGKNSGRLLSVPASNLTSTHIDFRDQEGVYILYSY